MSPSHALQVCTSGSQLKPLISETNVLTQNRQFLEGSRSIPPSRMDTSVVVFVCSVDNFSFIALVYMKTNIASVGNTGHFHNEIELVGSEKLESMQVVNIKPHKGRFVFPLATYDCANFQTYNNDVYFFLKELVEKVAKLHSPALNMELTVVTQSELDYTDVKVATIFEQ